MMPDESSIRKAVRDHYAQLAQTGDNCGSCCNTSSTSHDAPPEARQVYAGCGSPVEAAGIREGEVVVDLGSGGGYDAFRASKLVGQSGLVIGVDATPEMVWRARETAKMSQFSNVDFRLGEIEHIPAESNSVDVILSNCVINLSPDKSLVFREAFRILRPDGRIAISDVVARNADKLDRTDLNAWAECVAGALPEDEYVSLIKKAGFVDVRVRNNEIGDEGGAKGAQSCCGLEIASITITARKPAAASRAQGS